MRKYDKQIRLDSVEAFIIRRALEEHKVNDEILREAIKKLLQRIKKFEKRYDLMNSERWNR